MSSMVSHISGVSIAYNSTVSAGTDKKKTSKLCITGLCEGTSLMAAEVPTQRAHNEENVIMNVPGMIHQMFSKITHSKLQSHAWS